MIDVNNLPGAEKRVVTYPDGGRAITSREELWTIYSITNTKNKKRYIGKTANLKRRVRNHLWQIQKCEHPNINDYGDDFKVEILMDKLDRGLASYYEMYYMIMFFSFIESRGYNTKDHHFYSSGRYTQIASQIVNKLEKHNFTVCDISEFAQSAYSHYFKARRFI